MKRRCERGIVDQPDSFTLDTIEEVKIHGGSTAPYMTAIFECGAYLCFVQEEELLGSEVHARVKKIAQLFCCARSYTLDVGVPGEVGRNGETNKRE